MAERTNGRSSEEIRRNIERTRSHMDETVDTLEDRLAPRQLAGEAWSRLKHGGGDVREQVESTVREHPVPLALVGLGVAWFAIEAIRGRSMTFGSHHELDPGTVAPAEGRRGPYGPDAINRDDPDWEYASRKNRAVAKAKGLGFKAREATHRARHLGRRISTFVDENPLAVGAIAFGVGIASAMSVPVTEAEERAAGRATRSLKRNARELGRRAARDATERAARAAEEAADQAREDMRATAQPPRRP